ncbi:MAG: hypothetical protein ACRC2R_06065 [Xenococcaceae cyanobacterium]
MIKSLKTYLKESTKLIKNHPCNFNLWELYEFFFDWQRSLDNEVNPLIDERPWLTFPAIKFLEQNLNKDMRVYEYGVGGSTLFFIKRVKEVISVEHDPNWLSQVSEIVNIKGYNNWKGYIFQPTMDLLAKSNDPSDPYSYISNDENLKEKFFKDYAISIDKYPEQYFDLVLIDGRARPSCFNHAKNKIKMHGFIILDNAERPYYSYIHQSLNNNNWLKYDFYAPGPYINYFWQTSIWQRVKA